MWELTLVCDCSRVFNRFSADLDAGFQFSIIWAAPPFSTSFPLAQQIFNRLHLQFQFKFSTGSMVFNWFVGSFNRLNRFSTGCVGSFNRFSTGRQTGFQLVAIGWQWSFHAMMAIVARNEDSNRRGNRQGEFALAIVYARTAAASVSARGEVMVELRRKGT